MVVLLVVLLLQLLLVVEVLAANAAFGIGVGFSVYDHQQLTAVPSINSILISLTFGPKMAAAAAAKCHTRIVCA